MLKGERKNSVYLFFMCHQEAAQSSFSAPQALSDPNTGANFAFRKNNNPNWRYALTTGSAKRRMNAVQFQQGTLNDSTVDIFFQSAVSTHTEKIVKI